MPRNSSNNRGGNRSRRSKNNNPEGHNQYSNGWMDTARERPVAAAAAAAAAVGAGVFLWSKRGQISDQLSQLSDQIGEWTENMSSEREFEMAGGENRFSASTGGGASGDFGTPATGSSNRIGSAPSRTASKRRSATSGSSTGSGTMSGGSIDTGPSGRGRE
ncbi:hypothetical protein [Sphingomonas sp.]|uniref:hypothetical protein n=1 Tax=Sphingomonas sp. TaxID=28214 RepID=UPI0017A8CFEF|nr:hypothetical protein [Sphingomonas sp.]MBA3511641.1 hypothetical protein [Sphingomonas sp.]